MITITQAKEQGFTIDDCAPGRPFAYKGPRFAATSGAVCYTELEEKMLRALALSGEIMNTCGGDRYERECVKDEREEYNTLMDEIESEAT